MNIRNRKEMHACAVRRLREAPQSKTIVAIFAGIAIGLSLLGAGIQYLLSLQINQHGGLGSLGIRSFLSTLQTILPPIQSILLMCLEVGYMAAMLRVARGQYTSPQTLRLGFDRFWVLLRFTLLQVLILLGVGFATIYAGVVLYLMTPLSEPALELLTPLMSQSSLLDPAVVVPDNLALPLLSAMAPAFLICGLLYAIVAMPILYRLRMTRYVIIEKPGLGALAAMQESRNMLRGNCIALFRLDLHLWWYYAAGFGATLLCYGDQLLPLLGIELPFSADGSFFLFYGLYWVTEFLLFYYLRNQVEVTYALAYESLRPRESNPGVVLGNIFQM